MKKIMIYIGVVLAVGMVGLGRLGGVYAADENLPDLYIRAVNPGYKIDGLNNVGEMIEISRKSSDKPISLAGVAVGYTNTSGNHSTLFEFPENSFMTGETILLRLASSPNSELAAVNYTKTLAMKGGIDLTVSGEVVDSVCWTSKDGCYKEFKSTGPTTLVRNLETGEFEHIYDYEASYDPGAYYVEQVKEEEGYGAMPSKCRGLEFSEIMSYYEESKSEQFIELHNSTAEQMRVDGCMIRYKNKDHRLAGVVKADGYLVYYPKDFSLTKNPKNGNLLELVDANGEKLDSLVYPNGQRKGTSYALIGYDGAGKEIWRTTYALTPGGPNNYQEYKTCEEGKVINKATGNCVKVTEIKPKICKDGYYLNILSGRCKKKQTEKEKTCKDGYYLNPETGRCRKIKENNGADYGVQPETYEEKSSFVALYVVIGVVFVGLLYIVYEFRHEIWKLWRKVGRRFH